MLSRLCIPAATAGTGLRRDRPQRIATSAYADTCFSIHTTGGTDWCLVFLGPVEADYPLQLEGLPIHLVPGDIIKAQATAGATHTLHVHLSGLRTTRTPEKK